MKLQDIKIGLRVKSNYSHWKNKIGTIRANDASYFTVIFDDNELTNWYLSQDRADFFDVYVPDDMS